MPHTGPRMGKPIIPAWWSVSPVVGRAAAEYQLALSIGRTEDDDDPIMIAFDSVTARLIGVGLVRLVDEMAGAPDDPPTDDAEPPPT
jgi:hypothetical protein